MMVRLALVGFAGTLAHAAGFLPRVRYTHSGGMRFFRIGRLQTSFCWCRRSLPR